VRIYSASSEEAFRTRELLAEWAGDGLLSETQHQQLEKHVASELHTTNIFLRLILFFFTLVGVGATVALFFAVFRLWSPEKTSGFFLLIFAGLCYFSAEWAVSRFHLYRYGIEEALATCSCGFLCAGMWSVLFSGRPYFPQPDAFQSLVPASGAVFSLWLWRRFGFCYAFPAAMIFALFLPDYWTSSHSAQHVVVVLFYGTGLICIALLRARHSDFAQEDLSIAEAFLWLGTYLALNLQLSTLSLRAQWGGSNLRNASEFSPPFYWMTWVVIWLLPAFVLVRGIRKKDRLVMAVGAITAVLTFISNKPYLGWPRHTWDPMLQGILLAGVALFIRRWLEAGPGGIRGGFTAARLSARDKQWIDAGSVVVGIATAQSVTPAAQTRPTDFHFGGGSTGGGGAGGDF